MFSLLGAQDPGQVRAPNGTRQLHKRVYTKTL